MNIIRKKMEKEDFDHLYAIIYREYLKIAKNTTCNAIEAYDAIYTVITNDGGYEEALYWLTGDFMYTCAKEKRKTITSSDSWFETYCSEFAKYSCIVNSIDALCLSLNESMKKGEKARKIDEFGFLLWEKCVIQHLTNFLDMSFSDALLKMIDNPPKCFLDALLSLSVIIPDKKDRSYYYKKTYEENAINFICKKYDELPLNDDIYIFIKEAKEIYEIEKKRMESIFLKQSHKVLIAKLDEVIFRKRDALIYSKLYSLLQKNVETFSFLFHHIKKHSKVYSDICKRVIYDSLTVNLRDHVLNKDKKVIDVWFNHLYLTYTQSLETYKSCFDDTFYIIKIFKKQCNKLKNPTFAELTANYFDFCTKSSDFESYKAILSIFTTIVENKAEFNKLYIHLYAKRLLTYKADLKKEVACLEMLKMKSSFLEYKKCLKMLKDISVSFAFNKKNSDNVFKMIQNYISQEKDHKLIIDQDTLHKKDEAVFYTSVLTFCAWPYSDTSTHVKLILPKLLDEYLEYVKSAYDSDNQTKTIKFNHDLGILLVEIETDRKYSYYLNIYQYIIIMQYNDRNSYTLDELSKVTNIKKAIVKSILETFETLIVNKNDEYYFNDNFKSDKDSFYYKDFEYKKETIRNKEFDLKGYYKALIARVSKANKMITEENFLKKVKLFFTDVIEFDLDFFQEILKEVETNGLIEVKDGFVYYDP